MSVKDAWAAGFLDGEGHLAAYARGCSYRTVITASQTRTEEPLELLADLFGGTVNRYQEMGERNAASKWWLQGSPQVRRALVRLIPYMVVKRREAELLLALATLIPARGTPGANRMPSEEIVAERNRLALAIKEERQVFYVH